MIELHLGICNYLVGNLHLILDISLQILRVLYLLLELLILHRNLHHTLTNHILAFIILYILLVLQWLLLIANLAHLLILNLVVRLLKWNLWPHNLRVTLTIKLTLLVILDINCLVLDGFILTLNVPVRPNWWCLEVILVQHYWME